MPFSILMQGTPTDNAPVAQVQGPALQGMFLHLLDTVDHAVCQRLHDDSRYRPYTLSPLTIGKPASFKTTEPRNFQGFWLPKQSHIQAGTPCSARITLLEDPLFPTFSRYFLSQPEPTFRLGRTQFQVTNVLCRNDHATPWSAYRSYTELIGKASRRQHKITLHFLTPTSFRRGDVDFPLPDPRLVFRSYRARFEEFARIAVLPDFDEQVECYTGIARLHRLETATVRIKKVRLVGFVGSVTYLIDEKAPPDLIFQMNLLADFAYFCGTGRKTTMGMGQTVRGE